MAKHDQRILKFLNQNSDRAPTITEMMTRLNISISDISDSLGSLQSQGLISKKTNGQGIECWFPTASQAAQPIPVAAMQQDRGQQSSSRMLPQSIVPTQATQQMPVLGNPVAGEARGGEVRSGLDSRFLGGMTERSMSAPEPQPPMAKVAPVHHIGEPSYAPSRGFDSSARNPVTEAPSLPEVPPFNPNAFGLAPARHGVGIFTLAAGLVAAVALSTFLATRLVSKEVQKASAGFVDRKTLEAAKAELAQFDEKTKAHVQALENDLKRMSAELALSKATAESLKVAAAKPEPAKAEAKGKAKKAVVAKAKSGSGMTAMAKAAARGAAMRKKAKLAAASRDSESDAVAESGYSESSRGVPEPPGLEDLPPPPSE
jgi:hypothetical protein